MIKKLTVEEEDDDDLPLRNSLNICSEFKDIIGINELVERKSCVIKFDLS